MNRQNQELTIDRLESLLDTYGGDLSRWPERLAPEAHALIGSSSEARRLHAEAQALDLVLSRASTPDPERLEMLAQRIIAAAEREGFAMPANRREAVGRIIPMPVGARAVGHGDRVERRAVSASPASGPPRSRWFGGGNLPAAAALAASLAFGIAIGVSDVAPTATYNVASLVQPAASDAEIVLSELQLDTWNGLDEDQI